jgi:hypothetical protein
MEYAVYTKETGFLAVSAGYEVFSQKTRFLTTRAEVLTYDRVEQSYCFI